jgi:protein tyrosine/serine phosphatase
MTRRMLAVYRPSRRAFLLFCLLALALASAANFVWKTLDNFHEVLPGVLYRSAQLSASSLDAHARLNGLRTIINLRGPNPAERWYRDELTVSQRDGLIHIDLPIDSLFPTNAELVELVHALQTAPRPILVHCQSGIDRTGIASALACLLLDDNSSTEQALEQLGWQYGSMPWRKSRENKRDFLLAYAAWLRGQRLTHSRQNFQNWLHTIMQIDGPVASACPERHSRRYSG